MVWPDLQLESMPSLCQTCLQPALILTGQVIKSEQYYFDHGGSADIWKGQWINQDSVYVKEVAVKVLKGPQDPGKHTRLLREIRVWSAVRHKYITPFFGVTFDFDRPCAPCLVSPYYRNGNIMSYVKVQPAVDKVELLAQVALGLSYLHSLAIVHGDLKGSNILINDQGEANITDFGLSRILEVSGFTTKTAAGTYRYMAPELYSVCEEEDADAPRVTVATDVWAFSMTVVEICTESVPFSNNANDANVLLYVKEGGRPQRDRCLSITNKIWTMLEGCWVIEPNRRPSMATLSRFFASHG